MLGKGRRLNPLESRKQLLIAESELNRAQLSQEWQTLAHEAGDFGRRAKTLGGWALSAVRVFAGLTVLRTGPPAPNAGKSSWFQKILNGARLASTFWFAFRGYSQRPERR